MLTLTRQQVRDVDRIAIQEYGLPGIVLMENAARGAVDVLCRKVGRGPVVICVGRGNNGGDGLAMARHLMIRKLPVTVILCAPQQDLRGDAAINYHVLKRAGMEFIELSAFASFQQLDHQLAQAEWIVDALLGTGVQGTVREPLCSVIDAINRSGRPVMAVDLPSGFDCDTGVPGPPCIQATVTVTFVALKPGFQLPDATRWTGDIEVIDIGVPPRLIEEILSNSMPQSGA